MKIKQDNHQKAAAKPASLQVRTQLRSGNQCAEDCFNSFENNKVGQVGSGLQMYYEIYQQCLASCPQI